MNNKLESQILWAVLGMGIFGLSGCTMNLPPANEPIPTADPILLPGKATTGSSGNSPATNTKSNAKPIEVVPSTTNAANNKAGRNEGVINLPAKPSRQGQTLYIVKPKDTVFEVMRQTGVHWKEIIRLNNLKAPKYIILPGQSLRIR